LCNLFCSRSKGLIFSRTAEYFTFAVTHDARGAAATEARLAFLGSKDSFLSRSSFSTACLFSVFILRALKDLKIEIKFREKKKVKMIQNYTY
jgi:hypothetical protein